MGRTKSSRPVPSLQESLARTEVSPAITRIRLGLQALAPLPALDDPDGGLRPRPLEGRALHTRAAPASDGCPPPPHLAPRRPHAPQDRRPRSRARSDRLAAPPQAGRPRGVRLAALAAGHPRPARPAAAGSRM